MIDTDTQEPEPEESDEGAVTQKTKGRRAFRNVRRELSEEDLTSPGAQKLLIEELERLDRENAHLVEYRDAYYGKDREAEVLKEKLKTRIAQEVVFGVCLTVGAAILGIAPALWSIAKIYSQVSIVVGIVLIGGGIASRVIKR